MISILPPSVEHYLTELKKDLCSDWQTWELAWLGLFLLLQMTIYLWQPDSILGMITGISGIICTVLVSKGKISNFLFGLIFAYSYFYVSLENRFFGEVATTIFIYIPAQFVGYFLWKDHLNQQNHGVIPKHLSQKGWVILVFITAIASTLLIGTLKHYGGQSVGLDGITTVLVCVAQILMTFRYREQWIFWIVINILSIMLWAESPAMIVMYLAYLCNSIYGYYNWTKLSKTA